MSYDYIRQLAYSYWAPKVLFTALRVGIFDYLSDIPRSIKNVAVNLNLNDKGTEIILNALVSLNLVKKDLQDQFFVAPDVSRYLSKSSIDYKGAILYYLDERMKDFLDLEQFLLCKDPLSYKDSSPIPSNQDKLRDFILGMENITREFVTSIVKSLPLGDKKRILDLGGGVGNYTVAIAQECAASQVVYYDLPEVCSIAQEFIDIKKYNNISYIKGNFLTDPIGGEYDFVWVSQIIHRTGDKNTTFLIDKIYKALEKEGVIAIHDKLLDNSKTSPNFTTMMNVFWFVTSGGNGRAYSVKEIESILKEIGFFIRDVVYTSTANRIIIAQK